VKAAICDDEVAFQLFLREKLESYYGMLEIEIEVFCSGMSFIEKFREHPYEYQLIFMDIEMPGINGIETSKLIRNFNPSVPVIFLTSHREFALEGYEVAAFRFLEKPLQMEKLEKALNDYNQLWLQSGRFSFQDGENTVLVNWTDILYVHSENVYIHVYMDQGKFLIRKRISEMENQMPKKIFFKPHRSYLINLGYVSSFDGRRITMKNSYKIPVSRGKREELKAAVLNYLRISG
jgi:two-component system LytT family response regulator